MRLIAAINAGLGAGLAVRAVFEAPTVAQLALRVGEGVGSAGAVGGGQAAGGGCRCRLPRAVVVYGPVAGAFTDLQHGGGVAVGWGLDVEALGVALGDVVGRHESLRTLFPAVEGIPQQVVVPVERVEFGWEVVDAARLVGKPVG